MKDSDQKLLDLLEENSRLRKRLNEIEKAKNYARIWNDYITNDFQRGLPRRNKQGDFWEWQVVNKDESSILWPGDEWGDEPLTKRVFHLLAGNVDKEAKHFVELGAGAGRYTVLTLEHFMNASVYSFDVSAEFEKVLRRRLNEYFSSGRLFSYLIDTNYKCIYNRLKAMNLKHQIDCIYSLDAMVHVDLHTLVVYWITAALTLKNSGKLIMSVADCTTEHGTLKLINNAPGAFRLQGNAGYQFMWISNHIVQDILAKLGFSVTFHEANGRDCFFVASLKDRSAVINWISRAPIGFS